MINIIRNGRKKKQVWRCVCPECDCVWETDEVTTQIEGAFMWYGTKCPYCHASISDIDMKKVKDKFTYEDIS